MTQKLKIVVIRKSNLRMHISPVRLKTEFLKVLVLTRTRDLGKYLRVKKQGFVVQMNNVHDSNDAMRKGMKSVMKGTIYILVADDFESSFLNYI